MRRPLTRPTVLGPWPQRRHGDPGPSEQIGCAVCTEPKVPAAKVPAGGWQTVKNCTNRCFAFLRARGGWGWGRVGGSAQPLRAPYRTFPTLPHPRSDPKRRRLANRKVLHRPWRCCVRAEPKLAPAARPASRRRALRVPTGARPGQGRARPRRTPAHPHRRSRPREKSACCISCPPACCISCPPACADATHSCTLPMAAQSMLHLMPTTPLMHAPPRDHSPPLTRPTTHDIPRRRTRPRALLGACSTASHGAQRPPAPPAAAAPCQAEGGGGRACRHLPPGRPWQRHRPPLPGSAAAVARSCRLGSCRGARARRALSGTGGRGGAACRPQAGRRDPLEA
jgi:hypothetical protein